MINVIVKLLRKIVWININYKYMKKSNLFMWQMLLKIYLMIYKSYMIK